MSAPIPKFEYVRDLRIRDAVRTLACQCCGADDGTVTWAHSNQAIHGKGGSIKASDIYVAALCFRCHCKLDQGSKLAQEARVRMWRAAFLRTILLLKRLGRWPPGVPMPELT